MKLITSFLRLVRWANLLIIGLSLSFFYYLIIVPVHRNTLFTTLVPFPPGEFVLFVLSVIFIAAAGNIINDYFDFELDKEFKSDRPIASGDVTLDTAMYLHIAFVFAGIGLGFYLGWRNDTIKTGYLYVFAALTLYLYSAYLKKIPLAGNIVIAALSAFVFVLPVIFDAQFLNSIHAGNLFENTPYAFSILLAQMRFYACFAFLTSLAREIVKDIEDQEGDAEYRINTLPVEYGENWAKGIAVIVLLVLIAGLVFFMSNFFAANAMKELVYVAVALVLPAVIALVLLVKAKEKKDYGFISNFLKVIMLLGILSIPAFYLLNIAL